MTLRWFFLLLVYLLQTCCQADEDAVPLLWASAGGGWRAMTTVMGYANLMARAGLWNSTSSAFDSLSTNSGASWFSTQFFFSSVFFERTLADDPDELHDFIIEWMNSYRKIFQIFRRHQREKSVSLFLPDSRNNDEDEMASFFIQYGELSTPAFFQRMLELASTDYGDEGFVYRPTAPANRVPALQNTSLYLQAGLSPVSRIRKKHHLRVGTFSYLGPATNTTQQQQQQQVYRVLLPCQVAVEESGNGFYIGVKDEDLPLQVYTSRARRRFRFQDWTDYHLFEGLNTTTGPIVSPDESLEPEGVSFSDPFGGQPTAGQAALASSIVTSSVDGLSPATFAQRLSLSRYSIDTSDAWLGNRLRQRFRLGLTATFLYRTADAVGNLGLCSQWPNNCGIQDAQLADGGFTDGTSLGMHLARYSSSPRVKAIVTLNNFAEDTNVRFLAYFNTTFNQGIEPGDFLWAPPIAADGVAQPNPTRSIQIFEEFLDEDLFLSNRSLVPDVNVSSTQLQLTTIDNPALGVVAGQQVDLLIFFLEQSRIPTLLLGKRAIDQWKDALADSAKSIASNPGLATLVQEFAAS